MAFDQFEDDQAITGINVTPLVDITLVLLIIFMVTTSYIVHPSIKVDLPRAATGEKTKPSTVSVVLTRSGEIYLNGKRTTEAALVNHVREKIADDPDLQAVISADTALVYGRVVWLIDLVKQLGVRKYALNIQYLGDEVP
jgi:biopolymer transport protein ExbD